MPGFFKKVPHMSIKEIISLREESDTGGALNRFRSGLAEIVTSRDLWIAHDFKEFKARAMQVSDNTIRSAFEILEKRKLF
jgi:hypothetical protein